MDDLSEEILVEPEETAIPKPEPDFAIQEIMSVVSSWLP